MRVPRIRLAALFALTFVAAFIAFRVSPQQTVTSQGQPWDGGTRYVGWSAPSTLEIINDCKKDHSFSVTKENAGFLDFQFTQPVRVPGHKSVTVPVRFHTEGMDPGDYSGTVTVICIDCAEVPPCTQGRRLFTPHVRVVAQQGTNPSEITHAAVTSCSVTTKDCDYLKESLDEQDGRITQAEVKILPLQDTANKLELAAEDSASKLKNAAVLAILPRPPPDPATAVAVGHADRTNVVALGQQQLQDHLAVFPELRRVGEDVHAFGGPCDAGRLEFGAAVDLHQAQPAGPRLRQAVEMAEGRDLDAGRTRRGEDRLAVGGRDVSVVDA